MLAFFSVTTYIYMGIYIESAWTSYDSTELGSNECYKQFSGRL